MKQDFSDFHASIAAHDDQAINPSRNAPLQDVIDRRRRGLLKGGLGLAGIAFLGGAMAGARAAAGPARLIGFQGIPAQLDPQFDRVEVAPGYSARVFFSWGDPVLADAPQWQADASDDCRRSSSRPATTTTACIFSRSPMRRTATACW